MKSDSELKGCFSFAANSQFPVVCYRTAYCTPRSQFIIEKVGLGAQPNCCNGGYRSYTFIGIDWCTECTCKYRTCHSSWLIPQSGPLQHQLCNDTECMCLGCTKSDLPTCEFAFVGQDPRFCRIFQDTPQPPHYKPLSIFTNKKT